MPFDDEVTLAPEVQRRLAPPAPTAPFDTRLLKQLSAAWSLESDVGSIMANTPAPDANLPYDDPDAAAAFTVEDKLTPEEKGYSDRFVGVYSDAGLEHRRAQIEREKTMRAALADGPLPEWLASMGGGVASLSTLIPIAGPLVKGGTAARAAGSLLTVGTSAAAGAAVQESILQGTQVSRTKEESAASIIGAFLVGGVLGSAAGALTRPETQALGRFLGEARPRIETEITTMIRSAGLGDFPPPRTNLFDSTAVSRFLDADNSPNFKLPRVHNNGLTDRDLLNHVSEQNPRLMDAVTKAMREVEILQDRIDRLTADPTLFSRAPDIRDRQTLDLLAALDKEGTPAAKARAAQIREGAQPAVTLNRLLDEMDEATARWEAAEAKLAKAIKSTRDVIDEIGARIDAPERAQMSGEIADMYQKMKAALDEGKDPLLLKPKDPMAWLEGFAKFPGEGKAKTVSFISGKRIVADKKPSASKAADTADNVADKPDAKSLSAAAATEADKGGYTPIYKDVNRLRSSFKAAEVSAYLKKIGMAAPSVELSMSRFEAARDAIQRLVYTGMTTEGHFQGVAAPPDLHTEIARLANPLMLQVESIAGKSFDAYKLQVRAGLAPKMNRLQFNEAVAEAMTKGDVGPHPIISDAAKAYRIIDDKLKDLAVEYKVGVFKDGAPKVGDGKSHLYRAWSPEKIRTNPAGLRALAQDYFMRVGKADADDAADAATEVMHKILGSTEGRLIPEIKVSEGRGSLKERTFKIPDDYVTADGRYSTKDFVDRNVVNVMAQYVRTLSSDIAYQKILDGDKGIADIIDMMKREADDMVDALGPGKKESAQAKKIMDDFDRESRVITELTHRIRGTDPTPMDPRYHGLRSAGKIMRDFNVVRVMGSSIISQLPDLARPMVVHGFMRVFGSIIGDFVDGFKMVKIGKAEAQRVGTATDMVLGGRAGQIADLSEQVTRQSKLEMVTGLAAHKALTLFGVSPWTVYQKARVSYLATDDMLRQIEKIGKGQEISDKWRTMLASLGIDKETALAIYKEQPNWEEASRGFYVANVEKWKDQNAANKFSDALLRHIDNMIITPTAADKPLWMHSEVGKAVTQFQSFGWATHQRILIAGLQERDAYALTQAAAMLGLGMVSVAMRDIVAEGQVKERDVRGWLREGFDRSGMASRFMETDALIKKAVGTSPMTELSGGQTERSAGRGFVGQALGATAGLVDDTAKAVRGVMDGSLTGTDLHNFRRVMPLQNFILFRGILDQAEENLVNQWGLEPRQIPR